VLGGAYLAAAGPGGSRRLSAPAPGEREQLAQANAALQAGEADKALALLNPLAIRRQGRSAITSDAAWNTRWSIGIAANDCEQAVKLDGQNSDDHLWLGRALGEKASRASFLSAYSLAKRVRAEFEEAARLNPRNAEALADAGRVLLFRARSGGRRHRQGRDSGRATGQIDPARAHELRGRISPSSARTTARPSGSSSRRSRPRRIRPSSG
jgi:hypothetical protein